jgi:hypothetical protein
MSVALIDVIGALQQQINSIDGLRVYDHPPSTVDPPAAIIQPPVIDYRNAFKIGLVTLELEVAVLLPAVVDREQLNLFGYLDWYGPQSVALAIGNDRTLGGLTGVDATVMSSRPLGLEEVGGYQAWGCALRIHIGITNS